MRRITGPAKRALYKLMEEKLTTNPDGTVKYDKGWNDEIVGMVISKEFPEQKISTTAVCGTRNRCWGPLFKLRTKNLAKEVAELQEVVQFIVKELGITIPSKNEKQDSAPSDEISVPKDLFN